MKGSIKIAEISGITINLHVTFLLLLLPVLLFNVEIEWFLLVIAVFFLVTLHELAHSLTAKKFGVKVKEITLLPIGGVASMTGMPGSASFMVVKKSRCSCILFSISPSSLAALAMLR